MSANEAMAYPTQTLVACEACGVTVDVTWFCKQCPGSLCSPCKDAHKEASLTKKHFVVPRSAKVIRLHGPAKIAEQCRLHPYKEISAYCNKCRAPCCISCLVEKHKQHDFSSIEETYLAAEKRLNDFTKQLEKEVLPKLDEMEIQTRSAVNDGEQKKEKVKEEVNAFREELKKTVDETCDSLIDALDRPKSDLNGSLRDIDKQRQKINDLIVSCTHKVREGKLDIIEYIPPTPLSLLPTLTPPRSSRPVFTPGREVLDVIRNKLGTITYERKASKQRDESSAAAKLSPFSPKFDVSKSDIKKVKCQIPVKSITTAGNNTAWVMHYNSDTMYLYNDRGKKVSSDTVMKGVGINDIMVTPSWGMVVTNTDKKVRCVSLGSEVFTLIDTAPFGAEGVCLTNRGEIVVCMAGQGERNHVAVYSSDGMKKLREIRCQDDQGKQLLNYPFRAVLIGKGLCVVNNGCNVVCVDKRGDVRWVYGGTQAKLKKSFNPRGICRDKYQNLLVTDSKNHCVHYIDRNGQLIQIILTREQTGLQDHWGISVDDETGQVWVGSHSWVGTDYIVIAKYTE